MKKLTEYIQETNTYEIPTYLDGYSLDIFMEINGLTEDTVTRGDLRWFARQICEGRAFINRGILRDCDYDASPEQIIYEMLSVVSADKLKNALNIELGADGKYCVDFLSDDGKAAGLRVYELKVSSKIYDPEIIFSVCDRMMWTFTQVRDADGSTGSSPKTGALNSSAEYYIISVEPQYSERKTDFVKKNCDGVLYHVVDSRYKLQYILDKGLRMKGESNSYRYSKNKVFFMCGETDDELREAVKKTAVSKGLWDSRNGTLKMNAFVIKVDVSRYNVNFYADTAYDGSKGVVYSYAYFPPDILEDSTEEIKTLFK